MDRHAIRCQACPWSTAQLKLLHPHAGPSAWVTPVPPPESLSLVPALLGTASHIFSFFPSVSRWCQSPGSGRLDTTCTEYLLGEAPLASLSVFRTRKSEGKDCTRVSIGVLMPGLQPKVCLGVGTLPILKLTEVRAFARSCASTHRLGRTVPCFLGNLL